MASSDIKRLARLSLLCRCPRCGVGPLFSPGLSMKVAEQCSHCGFPLGRNDSADGPAVFLIFILGFLLVPIALVFDAVFSPPLWVHGVLWLALSLAITLGTLRPIKALVIALQYKYRPGDWTAQNGGNNPGNRE